MLMQRLWPEPDILIHRSDRWTGLETNLTRHLNSLMPRLDSNTKHHAYNVCGARAVECQLVKDPGIIALEVENGIRLVSIALWTIGRSVFRRFCIASEIR